jgi:hypothetical protein
MLVRAPSPMFILIIKIQEDIKNASGNVFECGFSKTKYNEKISVAKRRNFPSVQLKFLTSPIVGSLIFPLNLHFSTSKM